MTAAAADAAPRSTAARAVERGQALRRPSLELVPAASARAGRAPFAAVVVSLLVLGLLGLLGLNTVLAQDAFRLHTLKAEARALEDREQLLRREVEALRAPQALAARAGALGMVQAGPPAFLRLPDGTVLGAETAAEAPEQREGLATRGAAAPPAGAPVDTENDGIASNDAPPVDTENDGIASNDAPPVDTENDGIASNDAPRADTENDGIASNDAPTTTDDAAPAEDDR